MIDYGVERRSSASSPITIVKHSLSLPSTKIAYATHLVSAFFALMTHVFMVYTYEISAHGDPKLSVFVKSRWVQLFLPWRNCVKVLQETPSLSQWPPPFSDPFSSYHSYGLPITRGLYWPICISMDACCKSSILVSWPSFIVSLGEYWAQFQSPYHTCCCRGLIYLYHNSN